MSIRYERQGLRVVRTPGQPAEPALGPREGPVQAVTLAEAAALIRTAAAALRAGVRRRRAWGFRESETGGRGPHGAPMRPARDVTGAQLRAARQAVGLSQRALAQQFPYGRGLLASVELGYRSCPPDLGAWAKHVLRQTPGFAEKAQTPATEEGHG